MKTEPANTWRDLWNEAARAQLQYYSTLGRVARRTLEVAFGGRRSGRSPAPPPCTPAAPSSAPSPPESRGGLVLEGPIGGVATGQFLVVNHGPRRVSVKPTASSFADPAGRHVAVKARFEPPVVELGSGLKAIVTIELTVGKRLEPGTPLRGGVSLPGLSREQIPVVLRPQGAPHPPARTTQRRRPAPRGPSGARRRRPPRRKAPR